MASLVQITASPKRPVASRSLFWLSPERRMSRLFRSFSSLHVQITVVFLAIELLALVRVFSLWQGPVMSRIPTVVQPVEVSGHQDVAAVSE